MVENPLIKALDVATQNLSKLLKQKLTPEQDRLALETQEVLLEVKYKLEDFERDVSNFIE